MRTLFGAAWIIALGAPFVACASDARTTRSRSELSCGETFSPIRVAAGALQGHTDADGRTWSPDVDFTGGTAYTQPSLHSIAASNDDALFGSERFGENASPFHYGFDVPAATYTVNLYFAESFVTGPGQRVFDVSINGSSVLSSFDIYAAAGGADRAVVESFLVDASSGRIDLAFLPGAAQNPKVDGIEIVAGDHRVTTPPITGDDAGTPPPLDSGAPPPSGGASPTSDGKQMRSFVLVAFPSGPPADDVFGTGTNYDSDQSDGQIDAMVDIGVNAVGIMTTWCTSGLNGTDVRACSVSESRNGLVRAANKVRSRGVDLFFKPLVTFDGGGSARTQANPGGSGQSFGDPQAWFDAYWNVLSQAMDAIMPVKGVVLTSEHTRMYKQDYVPYWQNLITKVRARYPGVWVSNTDITGGAFDASLDFWKLHDFIGVDAYFPVSTHPDPSRDEVYNNLFVSPHGGNGDYMAQLFGGKTAPQKMRELSQATGLKIIFPEVGYMSQRGNTMEPGDPSGGGTYDDQEQTNAWAATLDGYYDSANADWFAGMSPWSWQPWTDLNAESWVGLNGYEVQQKPALELFRAKYQSLK